MNPNLNASESQVNAGNTTLYTRVAGNGQPIIILHGGPISTIAISFPTLTD